MRREIPSRRSLRGAVRLTAFSALLVSAAAPWALALPADSPFGVVAFIPGPVRLDAICNAGIAWARCGFDWQVVEPNQKGVFNWTDPDNVVLGAQARGVHVYAGLGYTPVWATASGDHRAPPTNPQDWADYCAAVVERYDGDGFNDMPGLISPVKHWELWNEPNLDQFFTGGLDAYIDIIVKVGADAIHAADPTAKVVACELFGGTGSTNPAWMRAVLQRAGPKVDIVSFHQYGGGDIPSGRLSAIDTMHNLIVSEGYGDRDIWITESGWQESQFSGTQAQKQQRQGDYLVAMLDGMLAPSRSSWFKKYFWYQLWEGPPPNDLWGLLYQDETPKPVWFRYRDYIAASAWPGGCGAGNQSPTVSLVTPLDGATFTAPASITAIVSASDPDGTIAKVELLADGNVVGQDTDGSDGFYGTVGNVPAGTYVVTARATDNAGATTVSNAVTITVGSGGTAVPTLDAKAAGAITVDGNPADWNLAQYTVLARGGQPERGDTALVGYSSGTLYHGGNATNASLPASGADHTAKVYCCHDATSLYFLARVDDSDIQTQNPLDMNWANDCVEIYIDPSNAGGAAALVDPTETSNIQLVIDAANRPNVYMTTGAYKAQVLAGVTSAVATDGTGWWLEVRIQKSALNPAIPASGTIGVEFNYRDNDANNAAAQTTVYNWSDTQPGPTSFPNKVPDRWGDLILPPTGGGGGNQPPTVTLTGPVSGQFYTAPATVNFVAAAADPDGSVAKVEFFAAGLKVGEDADPTGGFTFNWTNVAAGNYSLTARATDNAGAATTSTAVNVTVNPSGTNQPPVVTLNSPAGQPFAAPATINLTATASDADGNVVRVDFILGTTLLGSATVSPYTFAWTNVAAGTYGVVARATDNAGATATSPFVSITVNPGGGGGGTDADGDGMGDAWEMQYFGNLGQTGSGDPDADGLTNLREYNAGTNPILADTDGDGMKDGPEMTWGFNPLNGDQDANGVTDGLDDWNGNGVNNQTELAGGTNPGTPPVPAGGGGGGGGSGCWVEGALAPSGGAPAQPWLMMAAALLAVRSRRRPRC